MADLEFYLNKVTSFLFFFCFYKNNQADAPIDAMTSTTTPPCLVNDLVNI